MAQWTAKQKKRRKWGALALVVVLVLVLLGAALKSIPGFASGLYALTGIQDEAGIVPDAGARGATAVHFIDVGQGDAVLLEQGGEFALVDAGPPSCEAALLKYLENAGVKRLRYVFMSHPHADHIGAMQAVLERFAVEQMLLPDMHDAPLPTSILFLSLMEYLLASDIPTDSVRTGQEYPLGSGVVRVVQAGIDAEALNLISSSLMFSADGMRFLTTGDAEVANERAMVESGEDLRADLFKAGHHGSHTSNSIEFMQAVRPELAVASSGLNNNYGHPQKSAMKRILSVVTTFLRTDWNGTVVVWPNKQGKLMYAVQYENRAAAGEDFPAQG